MSYNKGSLLQMLVIVYIDKIQSQWLVWKYSFVFNVVQKVTAYKIYQRRKTKHCTVHTEAEELIYMINLLHKHVHIYIYNSYCNQYTVLYVLFE